MTLAEFKKWCKLTPKMIGKNKEPIIEITIPDLPFKVYALDNSGAQWQIELTK